MITPFHYKPEDMRLPEQKLEPLNHEFSTISRVPLKNVFHLILKRKSFLAAAFQRPGTSLHIHLHTGEPPLT